MSNHTTTSKDKPSSIYELQWGVTNHRHFIVTVLNFLYKMLSPRVEAWGQTVVKGIRLQNLGRDGKQIPLNRNHQDTPVSYVPPVFFMCMLQGVGAFADFSLALILVYESAAPLSPPHQTVVPPLEIYVWGELSSFLGAL